MGIDISERMIDRARTLSIPNSEFMVADLLEFRTDRKYDALIAFDSLWHISGFCQAQIYERLAQLIRGGGHLLFTHGNRLSNIGEMFGETFWYSSLDVKIVRKLLEANGFDVLSSIENYVEETTGDRELLIVAKKR